MAKTVIGLFDEFSEAQQVLQDLLDNGFRRDDISLIAHQGHSIPKPTSEWAVRTLSIPGIGPVLATGPMAAALTSVSGGPAADGLMNVLTDRGVPSDEAHWYTEGVRRGGALVIVEADDAEANQAADIMRRYMTVAPEARPSATMEPIRKAEHMAATEAEASRKGGSMETIERSIDLAVPVEMAYHQWTQFEQFPQFMEGVEEVRRLDAKRLHWVANIGGKRKEWQAAITEEVPNERISWRSEGGEFNNGLISFQPLAPARTRVTVRLQYEPKGLMERAGDALGLVSHRVEGDLERFKKFIEARERGPGEWRATEQPMAPVSREGSFDVYEPEFRQHYTTVLAGRGYPYEHWAPAYRYGYALANDPRYTGRNWAAIEADARRDWEQRYGETWEESKGAVHYAWEKLRGERPVEEGAVKVPVVEEEIHVSTRQVPRGGVRLYTRVSEQPVEQEVHLRDEQVHVERRPVDRPASEADLAAFKEGTVEVTETDEEPVVRKQVRVVEEVVVSKDVAEHTETVRDTVRRTEVEVEPIGTEQARGGNDFAAYESDFRTHYSTAFASRGSPYEHWAPAYRYGYDLAIDPRSHGRDWATVEPEARRQWEARHQGMWDEVKDAVRYAWDKIRGRR
jgi:uncharacterized protein (TIGR02271 family)